MRPNQKRSRGLSPLVIRSLGVLAITLMAMTTAPASGIGVPDCPVDCNPWGDWTCHNPPEECAESHGIKCVPEGAVPPECLDNCEYVSQCRHTTCVTRESGPGLRSDCVLSGARL